MDASRDDLLAEVGEAETRLQMFYRTDDPASLLDMIDSMRLDSETCCEGGGFGHRPIRDVLVDIAAFALLGIASCDRVTVSKERA